MFPSLLLSPGCPSSAVETGPTILTSPLPSLSSTDQLVEMGIPQWPNSPSSPNMPVVTIYSNSISDSDTEDMIAFDVQPGEGRLPQSSYTEEDSLFTWTDITGNCMHV